MILVGEHHQLEPIIDAELGEDRRKVVTHSCLADHQAFGDAFVAQPFADQPDDLALAVGQRSYPGLPRVLFL